MRWSSPLLLLLIASALPAAVEIDLVSVPGGVPADTGTWPRVSADGRHVVFTSAASDLVPGDTNGQSDVFVRDLVAGTTLRVSVANDGTQADGPSFQGVISADGRYVAFSSDAANLVPGDTTGDRDIFRYDLQRKRLSRVSVARNGAAADQSSDSPDISADGRYVVFSSMATNLVPGPVPAEPDNEIYRRDLETGTTIRVSLSYLGSSESTGSHTPSISGDGRYVAFTSRLGNVVPGGPGREGFPEVYWTDLRTGATRHVSATHDGRLATGGSEIPDLSSDGRHVVFYSWNDSVVADDTNDAVDVFHYDVQSGATTRVSVAADRTQADGGSSFPTVSADGRFVVFVSNAGNLVAGDTNTVAGDPFSGGDVFRRDLQTGALVLLSTTASGVQPPGRGSLVASVCEDGETVVFLHEGSGLTPEDTDPGADVFRVCVRADITGFLPLADRIYGDGPIDLSGVTAINADGPVVFSSSDHTVAIVDGTTITITGAGTTIITANVPAGPGHSAAVPVSQTLDVDRRPLLITADAASKPYGAEVPGLSWRITGGDLATGDHLSGVVLGTLETTATRGSSVGDYAIRQGTLAARDDYDLSFTPGVLSVLRARLTITADNICWLRGRPQPTLTWTITGLVNGDRESDLDVPVSIPFPDHDGMALGAIPITPTGGSDPNYATYLIPGYLVVDVLDVKAFTMTGTIRGGTAPTISLGGRSATRHGDRFAVTVPAPGVWEHGLQLQVTGDPAHVGGTTIPIDITEIPVPAGGG